MDIKRLEYFVSVADIKNFTKAAEKHCIAQTAMSRHILNLESELGVVLFLRNSRSVSLTPAGEMFYHDARKLVKLYYLAVEKVRNASVNITGTISIGFGPHEKPLLREYVKVFKKRFPNISIMVSQHGYKDLADGLVDDTFDIIFSTMRCPSAISGCVYKVIKEGANLYLASKSHPLASKNAPITPEDIAKYDMAVHCEKDGPFSPEDLINGFKDIGTSPRSFISVNSLDAKLALVESCDMIASMPYFLAEEYKGRFFFFPVPVAQGKNRQIIKFCATMMPKNENMAVKAFFDSIR